MKQIDRIMQENVPGYSYMKRAMPQVGAGREKKPPQQQKKRPVMLTEIAPSGKAVLRKKVTVSQAAKKLNSYEETGLTPQEVRNLIERERNLTRRINKLEGWD